MERAITNLFGTKAETLDRLKPLVQKSTVLDLHYFTVSDWRKAEPTIVQSIIERFGGCKVVVRSSAFGEDGQHKSMAGAFKSCLNVDGGCEQSIRASVEAVISSYSGNTLDQVLVQPMLSEVSLSGVVMTHDLDSGAPYYIVNYDDESGKTDKITGGSGVNKTVVVYRGFARGHVESPRVAELLDMTRELEEICGGYKPLDIEFAKTKDGNLYLLQVRRISVQKNWNRSIQERISAAIEHISDFLAERSRPRPSVASSRAMLGQMPDWNPAEIIGTCPRPLSISLYRYLITDSVWQEARAVMGYRQVPNETLMVVLAGRPYIDVRNSFSSFLPAGLDRSLEHALVDAWLDRLAERPELHDKVEFEIAQTLVDFNFDMNFYDRYSGVLSSEQRELYKDRLLHLTRANVVLADDAPLGAALASIRQLERRQSDRPPGAGHEEPLTWRIATLLDQCRELGTLPFAIIARQAFMAEALLRSAVARGAWPPERLDEFKRSLVTVAGELTCDFHRVLVGELDRSTFLGRYGHLRPGTYDILSSRYDQREDLFRGGHLAETQARREPFILTSTEARAFASLLSETGLGRLRPEDFLRYAELAIVGREHSKFVFTRDLSDAIELIAQWGERIGLSRDDLSYLALSEIVDTLNKPIVSDHETFLKQIVEARRHAHELTCAIRLGYIIRDEHDLYVVPLHRSAPNFVTSARIEGHAVLLDSRTSGHVDLFNKIVCIENADPGFDWIFSRGIAGLISKFGGANSHMTIRCAELGVPAAIGVGEYSFERLVAAGRVELNCGARIVRPAGLQG